MDKRNKIREKAMSMPGSSLKLFVAFCALANEKDEIEVSLKEIAQLAELMEGTTDYARKDLYERGLIEYTAGSGGRGVKNTYKLPQLPGDLRKLSADLEKAQRDLSKFETEGKYPNLNYPYLNILIPLLKAFVFLGKEERVESGKVKSVERGGKIKGTLKHPTLNMTEELLTFQEACRILGIPCYPNSAWAKNVRKSLLARIKEGYSREDMVNACRYAATQYENGDRWHKWKDLIYIWSRGLSTLLAHKGETKQKAGTAQYRKGEEREEWLKDVKGRVKK